jgi:hypothetical protein
MKKRGYSAIESSICLALFLIILLAALESFGITRSFFFRLKRAEEENQTAVAAVDKMKLDLLRAGSGLAPQVRLGTVQGIAIINNALIISSREKTCPLLVDISPGENRIVLETVTGLSPEREVCVFDEEKAEIKTILSIQGKTVLLATPLEASYSATESQLALLESTSLFFDEKTGSIRRKVNTSSAQPLLDGVLYFEFAYEKGLNLAKLSFALKTNKEKKYELSVYPKNIALGLKNP